MKKQLLILTIILSAFSCSDEPEVKPRLEIGKVYSKEEIDALQSVDPIPPGYCIVQGGGGYYCCSLLKDNENLRG